VTQINSDIDLVLIADQPNRAIALHDLMQNSGVNGVIRRVSPGKGAVDCVRQTGRYRDKSLPDLFICDFSAPDKRKISLLREIAFGDNKASVPVIVLTSPDSAAMLDSGEIDGGKAVMFTPTALTSFVDKMRNGGRRSFFKALRTLYQFGPILVRTPDELLNQDVSKEAVPA